MSDNKEKESPFLQNWEVNFSFSWFALELYYLISNYAPPDFNSLPRNTQLVKRRPLRRTLPPVHHRNWYSRTRSTTRLKHRPESREGAAFLPHNLCCRRASNRPAVHFSGGSAASTWTGLGSHRTNRFENGIRGHLTIV